MDLFLDIAFVTILFISSGLYMGKQQHEASLKNKDDYFKGLLQFDLLPNKQISAIS